MAICAACGNDYDKPIHVTQGDRTLTFDSFACAIHKLAPRCSHCGVIIVGHGVEAGSRMFCCAHCARAIGDDRLQDRA
jgi:hypothetical protein